MKNLVIFCGIVAVACVVFSLVGVAPVAVPAFKAPTGTAI